MNEALNPAQVRRLLALRCAAAGSIAQFARDLGISRSFISAVIAGRKEPSRKLCRILGIRQEKKVTWRKIAS